MTNDELIRWFAARLVDMAVQVEDLRRLLDKPFYSISQ